jgi:hypothetical protein
MLFTDVIPFQKEIQDKLRAMKNSKKKDGPKEVCNPVVRFNISMLCVRSRCNPIMFTKDMWNALHTHTKIATRRLCSPAWVERQKDAWKHAQMVRVWCRPDAGSLYGHLAGHLRYTHVFQQPLCEMTKLDVCLEGFPAWTVERFCKEKFPRTKLNTKVWVFLFQFFPLA